MSLLCNDSLAAVECPDPLVIASEGMPHVVYAVVLIHFWHIYTGEQVVVRVSFGIQIVLIGYFWAFRVFIFYWL